MLSKITLYNNIFLTKALEILKFTENLYSKESGLSQDVKFVFSDSPSQGVSPFTGNFKS